MTGGDHGGVSQWPTVRLGLLAFFVYMFGLLQYGYPMGVLNLTVGLVETFINESYFHQYNIVPSSGQISVFYGIANNGFDLGGALGSFASGAIADRFGRKFSVFLVPSVLSIISAGLYVVSFSGNAFQALLIGRIVSGISGGMACIAVPVYLNEFSPNAMRGLINGWHTVEHWERGFYGQHCLICQQFQLIEWFQNDLTEQHFIATALWLLVSTFFMPETPPYTYVYKNNLERTKELIQKYHGSAVSDDELVHRLEIVKRISNSTIGLKRIFADRGMKKGFVVAQVLGLTMALSGQTIINHFSTTMFETAGISTFLAEYLSMLPTGIMILTSTIVPTTVDRLGRRPLYLVSICIQFVGMGIYIICALLESQLASYFLIFGACVSAVGYSVGTGPITVLYATELVPVVARATVSKYCLATTFLGCFVVGVLFSVLNDAIGAYSVIPLCTVPQILTFTYLYRNLPETKRKTPIDIYNELNGNIASDRLLANGEDIDHGYNSFTE